ncbi:tripartite tricarboxylate transporter permease [Bacillus sp. Marseille-P3661]|uniref:tripartite tricarboxylate transporter permease n=1 Tax=Bacillus sp. Marseille-P3661 TaxID=1936234 RepID=UPI000C842F47|nr:tripartite tricarboxylate transporter permease [Bacillus sp. Marseille-P3661]
MLESLYQGLLNVMQPMHLLILLLAVLIGFLGGATPGISGAMLVLILLPITYGMDTIPVFLLLTAIYAAAVYSGSISAVLFRTPGAPEAIATVMDGYPMAKKGKAGRALGICVTSSAIGGVIGTIFLIVLTPLLANFALKFSSPEYFALAVLGLTVVASLSGGDLVRGLIGVLFGLFIATIGIDPMTGAERFTFGSISMMSGISFVPILIGLFAVSEVLSKSREDQKIQEKIQNVKTKIFEMKIFKQIAGTIARSSLLGTFIGILPGVGATTASMLSYSEAVRWSKTPEKFGTGIPEGIAAPESANNSAAMGAMVPLLALGIPGSATTAVILGAFILHGLQPGPMLLATESNLVYTIFVGLLLVNAAILFLAKPFISLFQHTLKVSYSILGPMILVFCFLGTFSNRNSMFDVWIMIVFGVLGFYLEKIRFPIATIILGIVLGPMAEEEFRRSLQIANGDWTVFFTRPISGILLVLAVISILYPFIKKFFNLRKSAINAEKSA